MKSATALVPMPSRFDDSGDPKWLMTYGAPEWAKTVNAFLDTDLVERAEIVGELADGSPRVEVSLIGGARVTIHRAGYLSPARKVVALLEAASAQVVQSAYKSLDIYEKHPGEVTVTVSAVQAGRMPMIIFSMADTYGVRYSAHVTVAEDHTVIDLSLDDVASRRTNSALAFGGPAWVYGSDPREIGDQMKRWAERIWAKLSADGHWAKLQNAARERR